MNMIQRFNGELYRSLEAAELDVRVIDEEKRIVQLSFSSETPVARYGEDEILSHKKDAVMLERINSSGCLLYNHNRNIVIGKILKAKIEKKRGIAEVQFDTDEQSEIIYQKVKSGTLKGVSVGYIIHEYETIPQKKSSTGKTAYIATRWEPIEISIVSVPADITVGVGRSAAEVWNPHKRYTTDFVDYCIKINQNLLREE